MGLAFLTSCATGSGGNRSGQIPLEDFFKNPQISQLKISPDGAYLAFLAPYKKKQDEHSRHHSGHGSRQATRLTNQLDRDIAGFMWKENSTIVFARDFGGDENYHIFHVNVDGSGEKDLTPFENTKTMIIDDLENVDRERCDSDEQAQKRGF